MSFRNQTLDQHGSNLLHIWKLDETGSSTRYDSYGSHNLSVNGTPTASDSTIKNKRSVRFIRASSQGLINTGNLCKNKTAMSFSFWMQLNSIGVGNTFIGESTNTDSYDRLSILSTTSNVLRVVMRDTDSGTAIYTDSTNTFSQFTWYHVVVVIDTVTDYIKAWVNGVVWINTNTTMGSFPNIPKHIY